MKVITNADGIVLGIGNHLEESKVEAGVLIMDGAGYGIFGQKSYDVATIPTGVSAGISKYDGTKFTPYMSEIDRLQVEAVDKYTLELMNGGIL